MLCDKCGKGHMRPTDLMLTSNPPQYPHRCDNCDAHQNFFRCYPYVVSTRGAPLHGTGGFLTDEGGVSG